jgi:hypothetical protein
MKTFEDLRRAVLALFPEAEICRTEDDQIIIYTAVCVREDEKGTIGPFPPDDE